MPDLELGREDAAPVRGDLAVDQVLDSYAAADKDQSIRGKRWSIEHLFIGRAGASTIAELTAVGRPAMLVPLPIATDDHQAVDAVQIIACPLLPRSPSCFAASAFRIHQFSNCSNRYLI